MADNKVNFLRGTSAEYEAKTKDNDTFYYTTDTKKLYLGENEVGNGIDPKVIQAHIDNQTIHAKVWRGTQEEYNAIEPKEDDTVYIIKDSDNTLADKLIDDTSTTATDKTWSAKKINENDKAARTAINTHAGNDEIHVTAEEKAAWNAVNYSNPNLLINPNFAINQRGAAGTISIPGYFVDRWKLDNGEVTINSDGTLTLNGTISQTLENAVGANVTASASAGTASYDNTTKTFTLTAAGEVFSSAKLEIGCIATPFVPPDPATELAKCQRYFHRLGGNGRYFRLYGIAYGSNSLRFSYNPPVQLRTTPTLTCSPGNWRFCVSKIPSDGGHYWNNEFGTMFAVDGSY